MFLVVGLGNPGKRYEKTRHNVGFMVLDALHDKEPDVSAWQLSNKFNANIAEGRIAEEKILLAKPMTFMNASGESVQLLLHYYKISHDRLIVVHDDKDIALGEVKIQKDRGHAGHNGIRSIIDHIGTKEFIRIRVGIANDTKQKNTDTSDFVLGKFGLFEKKAIKAAIAQSVAEIVAHTRT